MKEKNEIDPQVIFNSRLINASPQKIFSAFSEPEHLQNWWGPNGFTNTFQEFNFSKDGVWNFVMHGPDGRDYINKSIFREIIKAKKIVIEHLNAPHFILTVTLEEVENKTRISWSMLFDSVETRNNVAAYVGDANEQNFDRLENEITLIK
ncbi:MAG: SRPBCC family protein [Melioribacteraceae bacterium]